MKMSENPIKNPLGLIININRNNERNEEIIKNALERLNFTLYSILEQESGTNLEKRLKQDWTSNRLKDYDFLLCFVFVKSNFFILRIFIFI